MAKKSKSPEINRFIQLMDVLHEKPLDMEEKTGVSARTIANYLWNDMPIGGQLLRKLVEVYGVSVDWLLTGNGDMFIADKETVITPLIVFKENIDERCLQDAWWLAAKCTEESLIEAGAVPGGDYSLLDLYELSKSLIINNVLSGELKMIAHE